MTRKTRLAMALAIALMAGPAWAQNVKVLTAWSVTGNLTAATSGTCSATTCVVMPVNAIVTGVAWQISGTFVGTVTFEGSLDGINWTAVAVVPVGLTRTLVGTATAVGIWTENVTGFASARARCSAYTSGTIAIVANRSAGPPPAQ